MNAHSTSDRERIWWESELRRHRQACCRSGSRKNHNEAAWLKGLALKNTLKQADRDWYKEAQ